MWLNTTAQDIALQQVGRGFDQYLQQFFSVLMSVFSPRLRGFTPAKTDRLGGGAAEATTAQVNLNFSRIWQ